MILITRQKRTDPGSLDRRRATSDERMSMRAAHTHRSSPLLGPGSVIARIAAPGTSARTGGIGVGDAFAITSLVTA